MKKLTTALCAVLLMILVLMPGAAAAGPALSATRAYCIIDANTGLVLAQQNMNEELHPASITKVMTLALACEKAQGSWDGVKLTVSHEDVYSLAGTDSSHIALQEGEEVPLTDALYATQMASANDGANLLAEYFGGGTIADGVAKMNAQVRELGLAHTHFANPHGISGDDHYTSCYDMAQILRWALQQPGFETVFTRNEMYTMQPTNLQPVTRYFSQQDKMRIGSSRYHIDGILGSKLGYTNTARYSYACLAEQNGVRLICVTMQSELSTDKYSDVRTLLDDAFATFTGYTELSGGSVTAQLPVAGGGSTLVRLNLKAIAEHSRSPEDFFTRTLPHYCQQQIAIINARCDFLYEQSGFFENSFLVKEGLIDADRFVPMFGMYGLAEAVNVLCEKAGITGRYGKNEQANALGYRISEQLAAFVENTPVKPPPLQDRDRSGVGSAPFSGNRH